MEFDFNKALKKPNKKRMAVCVSGQMGSFMHTSRNHFESYILPFEKNLFIQATREIERVNDCDVFVYTSDAVSQRRNFTPHFNPISEVKEYLPGYTGWRKAYPTYGVIYNVSKDDLHNKLQLVYGDRLKAVTIEEEDIDEDNKEIENITKWEWIRKRQLWKMKKCNEMMQNYAKENDIEYDVVVRVRPDVWFNHRVNIESYMEDRGKNSNTIYAFGGWACPAENRFMYEFLFDGFLFGSPAVINTCCGLYDKTEIYPRFPEFEEYHEAWGDHVEQQLKAHIQANDLTLHHVSNTRTAYEVVR